MNFKIEPLSENKNTDIDTARKVLTVNVVFEKRIPNNILFRYAFCEIEYTGTFTEKEIADIQLLSKKGKTIIEGLLLDKNVRVKVVNLV